jgi:hypothetical protein
MQFWRMGSGRWWRWIGGGRWVSWLAAIGLAMLLLGSSGQVSGAVGSSVSLRDRAIVPPLTARMNGLVPERGGLRVHNQSPYPVRVVLLSRSMATTALATTALSTIPVHWDFAPWEGRIKGVLTVLAERTVQPQAGDVVMGFALDGSQRYWGPMVVGESTQPQWDEAQSVWRLRLE